MLTIIIVLEWQEETKIIFFCLKVTPGHQGFHWICQHCHQLSSQWFIPFISCCEDTPTVHTPRPPCLQMVACRGGQPGARVLVGPLVSSKESKVKFKSCKFEFQRHFLWLNDFFSSQVPSLKFRLSHRPVPHLSKGLQPAVQSAKFLQFSF